MTEGHGLGQIQYVCGTCGSTDVSRDAWADWNVERQEWELRVAFDYARCHACDGETRLGARTLISA
jgi:hypothetical protein